MGKNKNKKNKIKNNLNSSARESDERKLNQLQLLEVKRLQKLFERKENEIKYYINYKNKNKKQRIGL